MSKYVPEMGDHQHVSAYGVTFADLYHQAFTGIVADTPELRREAFRLRYQTYCVEQQYEDPALNSDGLERDQYDEHSVHALLLQRASAKAIGTIRLVCNKPGRRHCLPFHKVCNDHSIVPPAFLSLASTAEVSRLAISKVWRTHADRQMSLVSRPEPALASAQRQRPTPFTALGLLRMAVELAVSQSVHYFCAIMEPSLLRMLRACGILFEPLGALVQYHGWRQPCFAHVPTLLDGMQLRRPDIWELITDNGRFRAAYDCCSGGAPAQYMVPAYATAG